MKTDGSNSKSVATTEKKGTLGEWLRNRKESFLQAFIQKHQLFGTDDADNVDHPTLSQEEIFKQAAFQHGMSDAQLNKAIEQKG